MERQVWVGDHVARMCEGLRWMQQGIKVELVRVGLWAAEVEFFHSHILDLSNMDTKPA